MTEYGIDQIEGFDRKWTDKFAARQGWKDHTLTDPVDDLELFFEHIPGNVMLDVGCGWARYVFRFLDQGLAYQGVDHSIEMLKVAKENCPEAGFKQCSFRELPFSDNHFDGLWSCCSLSGIPKAHLVAVLQEHRRVLKSNGVMMVVMPALGFSDEMMYTGDEGGPEIYQAHYHLDELAEHLETAGFQIVDSDYRHESGSMFILVKKPN